MGWMTWWWWASLALADGGPVPAPAEGKVALVSFWATWCGPCRAELPRLDALNDRLPEGASVVAVNIDRVQRPAEAMARRLSLDLPVVWDTDNALVSAWGPTAMPAAFLIDAQGRVIGSWSGELDDAAIREIEAQMQAAVSTPAPAEGAAAPAEKAPTTP